MAVPMKRLATALAQRANYCWRLFATGFSFAVFGVGGLLIGLLGAPLLCLFVRDVNRRQVLAQRLISGCFYFFVQLMRSLGVMSYQIDDLAALQNSRRELLVANHPTLIDVVLLIAFMHNANCVVKRALWRNPFTRGPVQAARYVLNDDSQQCIDECVARLQREGAPSLIVFPEGTRTERGQQLNRFQRGAANIAIRAGVPIRPVLIRCEPSGLTKNEKWYQIPARPLHLHLRVLAPIALEQILPDTRVTPVNVRRLNHWLHEFFTRELAEK